MSPARSQPPGCFWVVFLVVGLILTIGFGGFMVVPTVRANFFYEETTCAVLDKRLANGDEDTFRPEIHIEYQVAGRPYRVWTYDATGIYSNVQSRRAVLDQFVVGRQYPCWYDPAGPEKSVLVRGFDPWCLMVLIPVVFVVIGAGGLIANRRARRRGVPDAVPVDAAAGLLRAAGPRMARTGCALIAGFAVAGVASFALFFTLAAKNAPFWLVGLGFFAPFIIFIGVISLFGRRLAAQLARALPTKERQAVAEARPLNTRDQEGATVVEPASDDWPTVPKLESAGRGDVLAVALAREPTGAGALGCLIPFAAAWIGFVSYWGRGIWEGHRQGQPDWFHTVFIIPFVLAGLFLLGSIVVLSARGLVSLLVGRVRAEVSAFPFRAGARYTACVRQGGGLPLSGVGLALVCRESATYTAGTSTSTANREVIRVEAEPPELDSADWLRTTLAVPASAMHSFASKHNKVEWLVEVSGRALGLLPWRGRFPVLVHPAPAED
jgi:hypothetical protein